MFKCQLQIMCEESDRTSAPQIQSYIVRIWREDDSKPVRFSAQNVSDGVRVEFATFDELFTHIWQTSQAPSPHRQEEEVE